MKIFRSDALATTAAILCFAIVPACGDDSADGSGGGGGSSTTGGSSGVDGASSTGSSTPIPSTASSTSASTSGSTGGSGGACSSPDQLDTCDGDTRCLSSGPEDCAARGDGVSCAFESTICQGCGDIPTCIQTEEGGSCDDVPCAAGLSCRTSDLTCQPAPFDCVDVNNVNRCLPDGTLAVCEGAFWITPDLEDCGAPCYDGDGHVPGSCHNEDPRDVGPDCEDCVRFPIVAAPAWDIVSAILVPSPFDVEAPEAWRTWEETIFAPQHDVEAEYGFLVPGDAHTEPYDGEVLAALTTAGITPTQELSIDQWSAPNGATILLTAVPGEGAPQGTSVDAEEGAILPWDLMDMVATASIYRDGVEDEGDVVFYDQALLQRDEGEDGASHLIFSIPLEATVVRELGPGDFVLNVLVYDAVFDGWSVYVPFTVTE